MEANLKAALLQEREQMRKRRHRREFMTIYSDKTCPICGRRHMSGMICRRHRGRICEKHCAACEYHESVFGHCTYRETKPADMRKWLLVYSHDEKDELWRGIYLRELIRSTPVASASEEATEAKLPAARNAAMQAWETVRKRTEPKYIIMDAQDENGDRAVVDADTGEVQTFIVKHIETLHLWACIQYLDIEA